MSEFQFQKLVELIKQGNYFEYKEELNQLENKDYQILPIDLF